MELGNGCYALTTVKIIGKSQRRRIHARAVYKRFWLKLSVRLNMYILKCKRIYVIEVGYFGTGHTCRQCVLSNKHLIWSNTFCLHKRVTFEIITPWKSLRSRVVFLRWWFPMLSYIILHRFYLRNVTPGT